jgi:hypothetical protein
VTPGEVLVSLPGEDISKATPLGALRTKGLVSLLPVSLLPVSLLPVSLLLVSLLLVSLPGEDISKATPVSAPRMGASFGPAHRVAELEGAAVPDPKPIL